MFEQHPVPQQISSYSFKLVGNMTLKQFFQLAGGAVVALILYALPITPYLKWPLILLSVIAGAAFAFLPIQDRPLEQWLFAFFRSIYSPTVFVWDKNASSFPYFKNDASAMMTSVQTVTPTDTSQPQYVSNIETATDKRLDAIANMMDSQTPPIQTQTQDRMPQGEMIGQNAGQIISDSLTQQKPVVEVKPELQVPVQTPVTLEKKGFETPTEVQAQVHVQENQMGQIFNSASINDQTSQAQFSLEAAPPSPPTQANTLVGQVIDSKSKIVEGAILEIKDKFNRPVRALKTNRAGHFMVVTPLSDGEYNIVTEKEGLTFNPVTITLSGTIVDPIAIKSNP